MSSTMDGTAEMSSDCEQEGHHRASSSSIGHQPHDREKQQHPLSSVPASSALDEVARRDYLEHMAGMVELRRRMSLRPLRVYATAVSDRSDGEDDDNDDEAETRANGADAPRSLPPNAKIVHLVRHGQGFHNLLADLYVDNGRTWAQFVPSPDNPYVRPELLDCPLTETGRRQARALQDRVRRWTVGRDPSSVRPQAIVSSPHTRALQTTRLAFEPLLDDNSSGSRAASTGPLPILVHEMAREETGVHACDRRRPRSELRREFPPPFNFDLVPEEDEIFRDRSRETKDEVGDRVYRFLEWLEARDEAAVAVSTHSAWLLTLLNGVCECRDDDLRRWFGTGEMRTVRLRFVREPPSPPTRDSVP